MTEEDDSTKANQELKNKISNAMNFFEINQQINPPIYVQVCIC